MKHAFVTPLTLGTLMTMSAVALLACSDTDTPDRRTGGAGQGTGGVGTAGDGDGFSNSGDGDSNAGDGSGGASPGDGGDSGCNKVDFLFVIDNSSSMGPEQAALVASFPGFIDTIQSLSGVSDYHIMVADTDEDGKCTPGDDRCTGGFLALPPNDVCLGGGSNVCQVQLAGCDIALGAGVIGPLGKDASNRDCMLSGGSRYILDTEPDVSSAFACVAQVGLSGHAEERPMDAMVAALSVPLNAPGGCNEGFLREDAILVVTIISDDPKREDQGEPADWLAAVTAAKGGDVAAAVVLGLVIGVDDRAAGADEVKGAHWQEFVELFGDRGLAADVSAPDYTPFFADAVSIIDTTCQEFVGPE